MRNTVRGYAGVLQREIFYDSQSVWNERVKFLALSNTMKGS
jgi:hypothetical protein